MNAVPFSSPKNPRFTFIDLFAGIGGFRLALQQSGGKCLFSAEWDKSAQKTYAANYGEIPYGDITKEETKSAVPKSFDLLCGGFPCQAFSIAGKKGGFEDTRGTLFFDVADIIRRKKPKAIFLENVKGLRNHNGGKTLSTILYVLRNDLGYFVPDPQVVNAKHFGLAQNRDRLYIVGFRKDQGVKEFQYPKPTGGSAFGDIREKNVDPKYFLSARYWKGLQEHRARHSAKGNGFGYMLIGNRDVSNAIVVGGMGRERNLIQERSRGYLKLNPGANSDGIRKMTPREWARLQGFPDEFLIPVADSSAYKQFGNSVAVPAVRATAACILAALEI